MVVNSAVAVLAGRLLELLPHRWVEAVVAALFAGGAAYLIFVKESAEVSEGEEEADRVRSGRRVALGAFTVIVVAELGDLTQILTANLVARYHQAVVGLRRFGGRPGECHGARRHGRPGAAARPSPRPPSARWRA